MRLHDPQRPQKDGYLLYAPEGQSEAKFGLPVLNIDAGSQEGWWHITIHMPTSSNGFGTQGATFTTTAELVLFFLRWEEDPEREIATTFKYEYSAERLRSRRREASAKRTITEGLAALGLGDD